MMKHLRKTLLTVAIVFLLTASFASTALAHHKRPCCYRPPRVVVPRYPPRYHHSYVPPKPYYRMPAYRVPAKKYPTHIAKTYVVRRGDTLTLIAKRYGTSVRAILAANPQVKNPNLIRTGQRLVIPVW
ncbi:MAG: hypothetical protein DCC55_32915 [Chloroflexi bacterium]|nr:MAG: hypothetical protein DCC55_32915 [Chloroflexota bacterium]